MLQTRQSHGRPGVLLVNLGTPDAPRTPEVRRYLRQFLSDPRVLDINPIGRAALLNLIILPLRPRKSAEAYREVWTEEGSPLLVHGKALRDGVQERLPEAEVVLAMRYGNPSIESGLARLADAGCDEVVVLPLFPQYASSSTGSAVEAVYHEAGKLWNTPFVRIAPPFYDDPEFVRSFEAVARPVLDEAKPDHVLFSYHGVPERHVTKSDPTGQHCLKTPDCCSSITSANRQCYSAHCYATTRALVDALGLEEGAYSTAFQSRLGRTPWLTPYTDKVVVELAEKGTKRLAVFCPSFVADCLETIEEIGMRAKEDFVEAGGEELVLVPSLNAHEVWLDAAAALVRRHLPENADAVAP
jgi:ferrochelatase